MLNRQEVVLFERIRRIRRHGLIRGSVSLEEGFEVSIAHARFGSLSLAADQDVVLKYFPSTTPAMPATMLPGTMIMD